jgi:hypothetical protein
MIKAKSTVLIIAALLFTTVFALGVAGIIFRHRAKATTAEMATSEWIGNARCLEKMDTMSVAEAGFKFAVLGDVQIGTAQLPRLMDALDQHGSIQFIIQTGDIVIDPDPGHYELLMVAIADSGLHMPMFVVPGNHDVAEGDDESFRRYFGLKQYWFKYGGALFIVLDNSVEPLTDEQYDWLEQVLEEQGEGSDKVFLFMHSQPIYWAGNDRGPVAHLYRGLEDIFSKYEIDYVFSGNWHGYHREEREGAVFVVNGRGGSGSHLAPCFYTIVEVNEQGISDRCFVLPPRVGILVKSLVNDWLIAHVGRQAADNPLVASVLMLLTGFGAIYSIILSRR